MKKAELVEKLLNVVMEDWRKKASKTSIAPNRMALRRVYNGLTKAELLEKLEALANG